MKKICVGMIIGAVLCLIIEGIIDRFPVKDEEAPAMTEQVTVMAEVGNHAITADDLKNYLKSRPLSQSMGAAEDVFKKRIDELVTERLVYQAALKKKLDQDPVVQRRIRQMVNNMFMEKEMTQKTYEREISMDELKTYYDAHSDEFNRPSQVRVADIFIARPHDASDERRAQLKEKADNLLDQAIESNGKRADFARLITQHSDVPDKYPKGFTDFFDRQGNPVGVDPAMAQAAFSLEKNMEVYPQVIDAADGFHIIMRIGKRAPLGTPFEKVARILDRRIRKEEVQQKRKAFLERVKQEIPVIIHGTTVTSLWDEIKNEYDMEGMYKTPPLLPTFKAKTSASKQNKTM